MIWEYTSSKKQTESQKFQNATKSKAKGKSSKALANKSR